MTPSTARKFQHINIIVKSFLVSTNVIHSCKKFLFNVNFLKVLKAKYVLKYTLTQMFESC